MIRREEARLRRAFRPLLLLSMTVPAACSSTSSDGNGGSSTDASLGTDARADAPSSTGDDSTDATLGTDAAHPHTDGGAGTDASTGPVACDAGPELLPDATDDANCDFFVSLPCGLPSGIAPVGCDLYLSDCQKLLPMDASFFNCHVAPCTDGSIDDASSYEVEYITCANGVGRRPRGLCTPRFAPARTLVGAWLAQAAHLEAASVHAFRGLEAELSALGAPRELVLAARRAIDEERRHARVTGRLARRHGAQPSRARVRKSRQARSLEALAIDNAVEGCVRETYGALAAAWQATHARDAELATAMRTIATDETRHAALAWALARWLDTRLDDASRARVAEARRRAIDALRADVLTTPAELEGAAGLPSGAVAARLVDELRATVWAG